MGGMTLPIYLISKARKNESSNLYQAVLMSPAGFHSHGRVTNYLHYLGRFFVEALPLVTDHFSVPDWAVGLAIKLKQDLTVLPASRDFLAYLSSLLMGGPSSGNSFIESAQVVRSLL